MKLPSIGPSRPVLSTLTSSSPPGSQVKVVYTPCRLLTGVETWDLLYAKQCFCLKNETQSLPIRPQA